MAIRDAARGAWVAARSDREDEARGYLTELLAPFTVDLLETVDVQVTEAFTLFVFHDPEDDVHIAVRLRGQDRKAFVVTGEDVWTQHGPVIESLAHLHELLPELEPVPEPEWQAQIAVKVGERYTHNGSTYEATQAHTTQAGWEPPNAPALWVKVV